MSAACSHTTTRGRWISRFDPRYSCRCAAVSVMCLSRTFHVRSSAKNMDLEAGELMTRGKGTDSMRCKTTPVQQVDAQQHAQLFVASSAPIVLLCPFDNTRIGHRCKLLLEFAEGALASVLPLTDL